jgi:hypothetical protein
MPFDGSFALAVLVLKADSEQDPDPDPGTIPTISTVIDQ